MQVAKISGIPIFLHRSLYILMSLFLLYIYMSSGLGASISALKLCLALFFSVMLHELGHAFMAKKFGLNTRSITLYPFGGIALIKSRRLSQKEEVCIAIAGPATNFIICLVSFFAIQYGLPLSYELFIINLIMCVFNMFPAYPMDGGRVLRGLLQTKFDYKTSTIYCIRISGILSLILMIAGIVYGSLSLIIVSAVLIFMISSESKRV